MANTRFGPIATVCLAFLGMLPGYPAAENTPVNYALNRPASGSPICKPGEEAEKAVNGRWASKTQDKFCTLEKPAWLQIDLQAERLLHGFTILHAGAGGEPMAMNTRDFRIRVSSDGARWLTVASMQGNTQSITRQAIKPTEARYVRLEVSAPTQTDDPATRIYELEAW